MIQTHSTAQSMLQRLGFRLTSPWLEDNVRTVLDFFQRRMPALDDDTQLGFLRGIDLHSVVRVTWFHTDTVVAAFRRAGEPLFKLFYTKPGTSPYRLGVVPIGRTFHRFRVCWPVEVLSSRAADFVFASAAEGAARRPSWRLPGGGGGVQYIIPNADFFLETITQPTSATVVGAPRRSPL